MLQKIKDVLLLILASALGVLGLFFQWKKAELQAARDALEEEKQKSLDDKSKADIREAAAKADTLDKERLDAKITLDKLLSDKPRASGDK